MPEKRVAWVPKGPIYRRLLTEKFEPETEREKVLTSIIVAQADNLDAVVKALHQLDRQNLEFAKALEQVAGAVFGTGGEEPVAETAGAAAAQSEEPAAEGHPSFPKDAVPTVVNAGTGPLPDEENAPIPRPQQPQVKTNAAPIPKPPTNEPKAARNGSKTQS